MPELGQSIPWKDRLTVRVTGGVVLALIAIGIPFLSENFSHSLNDESSEWV